MRPLCLLPADSKSAYHNMAATFTYNPDIMRRLLRQRRGGPSFYKASWLSVAEREMSTRFLLHGFWTHRLSVTHTDMNFVRSRLSVGCLFGLYDLLFKKFFLVNMDLKTQTSKLHLLHNLLLLAFLKLCL